MEQGSKPAIIFSRLFFSLVMSYLKYYFFSASVLFGIVLLIFIIITLGFQTSFNGSIPFFDGDIVLDEGGIISAFSFAVFILWIIGSTIKFLLKDKIKLQISTKTKILTLFLILTFSYFLAFVIVFIKNMGFKFILIFIFFYLMNNIFLGMFFLLEIMDRWLSKVLNQAIE